MNTVAVSIKKSPISKLEGQPYPRLQEERIKVAATKRVELLMFLREIFIGD